MAINQTPKLVSDLYILRRRSRHHRQLVMELADEGHRAAALHELRMFNDLEDEIDDVVQLLHCQFPPEPDEDWTAAPVVVDLPRRRTAKAGG